MREADIFESWANRIVEGTWSLPETPEQQDELKMLMSQPLIAGADGMNATEQLYGLVGDDELFDIINDIAVDPDANIWDDERVQNRLEELGVYMVTPTEPAQADQTPPVAEGEVYDLEKEYGAPAPAKKPRSQNPDDHNPYPYSPEEDDDYFREIFRKNKAKEQGMSEGLGYSQDPAQAKWYHEGRKAFKGGTTGNLIQDIAKKHGVPAEWIDAFHAGYKDQQGWGKDPVDEGDNLATFEKAQCNHTMEGEYCPEHGLAECGNYGMYESELARIKSLALDEAIMVNPGTTIMNPDTEKMANPELEKHNTWQKQDAEADRIKWGGGGVPAKTSAPQKSGLAAKPGDVVDVDAKEVEEGDIPPEFVSGARGQPTTLDVINYKDYTSDMKSNFGQDWKPDPKPTGPYDTAKLGSPRYSQPPVEESQDGDALLARIKSLALLR